MTDVLTVQEVDHTSERRAVHQPPHDAALAETAGSDQFDALLRQPLIEATDEFFTVEKIVVADNLARGKMNGQAASLCNKIGLQFIHCTTSALQGS
jgi:hypothetical protein